MDSGHVIGAGVIGVLLFIFLSPYIFYVPPDHKVYREGPDGKMVEVTSSESSNVDRASGKNGGYKHDSRYDNFDPDKSVYENMVDNGILKSPKMMKESGHVSSSDKGPGREYYIKGNISYETGEKIYHLPGDEYYDSTVIDESAGERWFSSEEEAQAAGWRHAYC